MSSRLYLHLLHLPDAERMRRAIEALNQQQGSNTSCDQSQLVQHSSLHVASFFFYK